MSKNNVAIVAFIALLFLPATSMATSYFVTTTGNNSSAGTSVGTAWLTIQKAADMMVAGDTVTVSAGSYSTQRVQVTTSGSAGLSITFQAQGTVVMKGFNVIANYITIKGFEIANTAYVQWNSQVSAGLFIKGGNNLVENNYIHDSSLYGIVLFGTPAEPTVTHDNIIKNNQLYHNELVGIDVSGRNNLIEGNEVWGTVQCHPAVAAVEGVGCPIGGLDADGMRFFGQGHIFRKNNIHDIQLGEVMNGANANINPHIDCFQTFAVDDTETAQDILFEQNYCENDTQDMFVFTLEGGTNNLTIKNNIFQAYGGINANLSGGNSHHLYIYNNVFANKLSYAEFAVGIALEDSPYSIIKNNIFYNQPYQTINAIGDRTGQEIDYNLAFNSNATTPTCVKVDGYVCISPLPANDQWGVNPQFVNPSAGDYHLQSGSPAINAGITVAAVTNDFDGIARPQGIASDIGALEFTTVPPLICQ